MKIVCPDCRTAYDVNPSALGAEGRQVRCARCGTIWFADLAKQAANLVEPGAVVPSAPHAEAPSPEGAGANVDSAREEPPAGAMAAAAPGGSADDPAMDPTFAAAVAAGDGEPAAAFAGQSEAAADPSQDGGPPVPAPSTAPPVDIESLAALRIASRPAAKRAPPRRWRVRASVAAVVALGVIDAGLIIGRADVVRVLPQTASLFETVGLPVNLRSLAFKDVRTTQEQQDGVPILLVEGTIIAGGKTVTDVPRMRFSIQAANGHEIYAWTALPTRTKLAPGEALPFRTRLASPPEQGRTAKVRFFTRHDLAAGLR